MSYQNCGTDFVPLSESQLLSLGFSCGPNLEKSFERSYYSFFRSASAKCSNCHGVSQTPQFAVDDIASAFSQFSRLDQEIIRTYALNPTHGGGAGGPQNSTAVSQAEANYNSCKSEQPPGEVLVTARTAPLVLNATATAGLRTWDLSSQLEVGADPAAFAGVQLHVLVRLDTSGATPVYELRRPSLRTGASAIRVARVYVVLNGVRTAAVTQTFRDVNVLVAPNTNPVGGNMANPTLTGNIATASMFLAYSAARPQDTLQFEFELIAPE